MLANIFTKTIRDRQLSVLVGVFGVVMVAVLGLAAYSDLDAAVTELYASMPEAFLSMLGLSDITSAGKLILGEVANLMAPMVLTGLGIAMGAAAVAGEEAEGTIGLLLGNPRSRRAVLLSKTGGMVLLLAGGSALAWAGSLAVAAAYSTDMSTIRFAAGMLHVFALATFFACFALLLSSWTGKRTLAAGTATGWLVVSFLAAGFLPLTDSLADLAKAFPWYYFNGSQPITNGVDWGHLAVLGGASLLFVVAAVAGLDRRDLRIGEGKGSLIERLRGHPLTAKLAARLTGRAKVSSITVKATTEYQGLATIVAVVVFYMALAVGPIYNALSSVLVDLVKVLPEALLAMVGFADMSTPAGWYTAEMFSMVVPASMIIVTAVIGARSLAGEEEARTMDLLLSNPVTRARVVLEKSGAMVLVALIIGVATFLGTAAGSLLGGLGIPYSNMAVISLLAVLLGLLFGGVALLLSAATGRRRLSAFVTGGLAFVGFFANAFLPVSAGLSDWARLSPFYYYLDGDPLLNGMQWANAGILAAVTLALVGASIPLFQRRDVRG